MIKLNTLKRNPDNPRIITETDFKELVESIRNFPKMLELSPIIIDADRMIYAGDKRYMALLELGYKEVPNAWVKTASDFTQEQLEEFLIRDNNHYGTYDWEMLANRWDSKPLGAWGVKAGFKPFMEPETDGKKVTDEDMNISSTNEGSKSTISCTCPYCGKDFEFK